MNTEEEKLIEALKTIEVPYLNANLVDLETIKEIALSDNTWRIELEFGFPIKTYKATVEQSIVEKLKTVVEHDIKINIKQKRKSDKKNRKKPLTMR